MLEYRDYKLNIMYIDKYCCRSHYSFSSSLRQPNKEVKDILCSSTSELTPRLEVWIVEMCSTNRISK